MKKKKSSELSVKTCSVKAAYVQPQSLQMILKLVLTACVSFKNNPAKHFKEMSLIFKTHVLPYMGY